MTDMSPSTPHRCPNSAAPHQQPRLGVLLKLESDRQLELLVAIALNRQSMRFKQTQVVAFSYSNLMSFNDFQMKIRATWPTTHFQQKASLEQVTR